MWFCNARVLLTASSVEKPTSNECNSSDFYWRHAGPDREALREGSNVYVKKSVLDELRTSSFSSGSLIAWKSYAWNLTLHLLGDLEGIGARKLSPDKLCIENALDEDTINVLVGNYRIVQKGSIA